MFLFFYIANSKLSSATPVLAGHTIKESDFQEKYLDQLFQASQVIGVFLQDKVSGWVYV